MPRFKRTEASSTDSSQPLRANSQLVLTGHRKKNRHHLVRFNGREIWLTREPFRALCDLVFALIQTETGLCQTDRRTILRLRREVDSATCTGTGQSLIECCDKSKYRLTLLSDEVMIETSFSELDDAHFTRAEVSVGLRKVCETMRPERDRSATRIA